MLELQAACRKSDPVLISRIVKNLPVAAFSSVYETTYSIDSNLQINTTNVNVANDRSSQPRPEILKHDGNLIFTRPTLLTLANSRYNRKFGWGAWLAFRCRKHSHSVHWAEHRH